MVKAVFMRRITLCCLLFFTCFHLYAQKNHKYPSLLWEITGKGLKKPSYLFGTMHVSSKMVFHLSDSFYLAIRNADVVALETNPESWQEDMYNFNSGRGGIDFAFSGSGYRNTPSDFLTQRSLKIRPYEKLIQTALVSNPSTIDNLLYRSYSEVESDYEENTYLDLYIYQVGKRWGKKVLGVERYAESMKLMAEAYMDAIKDKSRRDKSYEQDEEFSYNKLQDAYRTGNLDLLDTINRVNSFSAAFDEKFLFRRNEIQAASIDSIIKSNTSLFVGVGAAHLPGRRGVIELLRSKGYRLRPVKMGERESVQKEAIEKIYVPVNFSRQSAEDGFFQVEAPGKLYRFVNASGGFDQQQYADMANGSYYMVTRVQTNALLWGHNTAAVYKKVDSLLYENIPGKILSRQSISRNGYQGFDIVNRTRRGDYQRYNIFITPFEILFFKVSGNGDYVMNSKMADRFFGSIQLKQYHQQWKTYSPPTGGFSVELPHEPHMVKNGTWQYAAYDEASKTGFEVQRTDIHNYAFAEEDTFDLNLMEESLMSSPFIDKVISRKHILHQGYPALQAVYRQKDGSLAEVEYIIQGPHYYTLIAHGKADNAQMQQFFRSFAIKPFVYGKAKSQSDSSMNYTVTTPVFKEKTEATILPVNMETFYTEFSDTDEGGAEKTLFRDEVIGNDTTGEKIYISFFKSPVYQQAEDSISFEKQDRYLNNPESSWVFRSRKALNLPKGVHGWDYCLTDTNSSRMVWTRMFYKNGVGYSIRTETDTLTPPSAFLQNFFQTFQPADSILGADSGKRKADLFFADFFSGDSATHQRAVRGLLQATFDSTDFPRLKKALESLSWKEKKYLDVKKNFIGQLGTLPAAAVSAYLQQLYYASGDTVDLQYATLESLLAQKTLVSFQTFRNILIAEPPVLAIPGADNEEAGSFLAGLYDSLQLTAKILPDLLPLVNIEDYKQPVMQLMGTLIDSSLLQAKDYAAYLSRFQMEARHAWKKQAIFEKARAIAKAQQEGREADSDGNAGRDMGNDELSLYATLLMPFWDQSQAVPPLLRQLLSSSDKQLQYNTAILFASHQKAVPDSVWQALAASDQYRYALYMDLHDLNKEQLFPKAYDNQMELAKSKLVAATEDAGPDSIRYLEKLPVTWLGKTGYVYFFEYKRKKEDNSWKLATSGLMPASGRLDADNRPAYSSVLSRYDFSGMTDKKLKADEPEEAQLQQVLKQVLYSKRKSAREFYKSNDDLEMAGMMRFAR